LKVYHSIYDFTSTTKTTVTLGTFDGVHLGHKKIIDRLKISSVNSGFENVILTFFPHPRMVLQKESNIKLLNTIAERTALINDCKIDHLIIHPFDQDFSRLTAHEFVEKVLVKHLNVGKIIIGYDHRFGRNRTANINDLIEYGEEFGFEVEQITAQEIDEVSVSSTKIRTALDEGNIALANEYLGYPFFITGTVIEGKKLGRTIGFPTANIAIEETYKLIPKIGVYVVKATIQGKEIQGMMNIGVNPTIDGSKLSLEVHFLDFDENIYGETLSIAFLERIRDEEKFDSLDHLKLQLHKDKLFTQEHFQK
jgi:riboflavin kinase/FMN adenylyltransferase